MWLNGVATTVRADAGLRVCAQPHLSGGDYAGVAFACANGLCTAASIIWIVCSVKLQQHMFTCVHAGRAPAGAAAAAAAAGPMDTSRASSAGRSTAAGGAGDSSPHTPGGDDGTAAAGTGKRAKRKAVRSSQRAAAAPVADPAKDEAAQKVGLHGNSVECCWSSWMGSMCQTHTG